MHAIPDPFLSMQRGGTETRFTPGYIIKYIHAYWTTYLPLPWTFHSVRAHKHPFPFKGIETHMLVLLEVEFLGRNCHIPCHVQNQDYWANLLRILIVIFPFSRPYGVSMTERGRRQRSKREYLWMYNRQCMKSSTILKMSISSQNIISFRCINPEVHLLQHKVASSY